MTIIIYLTLSVPEKLENSIFEMPIIPETLNINNLRNTNAKSMNLHTIRKFIEYSLKNILIKQYFLLPFSRYCCGYYHQPSEAQKVKGLKCFFSRVSSGLRCINPRKQNSHIQNYFFYFNTFRT